MGCSNTATLLLSTAKTPPYSTPTAFRFLQPRNPYPNLRCLSGKPPITPLSCLPNPPTLREICRNHVPDHVLRRLEEVGYLVPTDVQMEALPILFSGNDCILHAQTGSGKTLTYLLLIFSLINPKRSAVQALIVVPTRELGMQVTKVARMLAVARHMDPELEHKSCTVMALLDGGMLRRHKSWLKAEPPTIVVATIGSLSQMLQKQIFKLDSMQVLVVDEVDFLFNSSKQVSSLRMLLTSYSSCNNRQTVFASASIPQHSRFIHDCIQQKWTKGDVVHVHVNRIKPRPACLHLDLGYVAEKRNINYCYLYYNMICPSLVLVLLVSRYKQLEDG